MRAQALLSDGKLVDDFLIIHGKNSVHLCNAPSPAATASLEIAKAIVAQVPQRSSQRRAVQLDYQQEEPI